MKESREITWWPIFAALFATILFLLIGAWILWDAMLEPPPFHERPSEPYVLVEDWRDPATVLPEREPEKAIDVIR